MALITRQSLVFLAPLAAASAALVLSCAVRPDQKTSPAPATVGEASVQPANPAPGDGTAVVAPVEGGTAPTTDTGASNPSAGTGTGTTGSTDGTGTSTGGTDTGSGTGTTDGSGTTTPTPAPVATTPVIDWAYVSEKVFQKSCTRCHSAPRNTAGVNLETYANAIAALDGIKATVLIDKPTMPPRTPLDAETTAILKSWVDAGAPETVVAP